jgi:hypothetical protein
LKTQLGSCLPIVCVLALPICLVAQSPTLPKPAPFPLQLEMRVPFEPTAFPSERNVYLMYELHLTNFGTAPLYLSRVEVLDADASGTQPITTFKAEQLDTMWQAIGTSAQADANGNHQIAGGGSRIVKKLVLVVVRSQKPFLCVC